MGLRDFFSRNKEVVDAVTSKAKKRHSKNDIACDTAVLKEAITKWNIHNGWKFENFADFIELIGLKTPVKLSEYDERSNSFKCITALGTEISISLFYGGLIDFFSQILVTDGEETRYYITNDNSEKGKSVPKVTLRLKEIKRCDKELKICYFKYYCYLTLKLDDAHVLRIKIQPNNYEKISEIFVSRNCKDFEEYLLGLDNCLVVAEVYEKMIKFFDLSNEDISKCGKIFISYIEIVDKEELVRGEILLTNGKLSILKE